MRGRLSPSFKKAAKTESAAEIFGGFLVGETGFEPATPWSQSKRYRQIFAGLCVNLRSNRAFYVNSLAFLCKPFQASDHPDHAWWDEPYSGLPVKREGR